MKKVDEESMIGSVAERTDNIINYSGALNTSEEFIENTVNVSGTLGPADPYSIANSAAKHPNAAAKTPSASKLQKSYLQNNSQNP